MSAPRTPRLQDVIDAAIERALGELYVCRPGKVVAYDAGKQSVDVQPIHRETYLDEDGEERTTSLPVIPRVPVMFPAGGGFRITFPLQPGDDVLLIFSDVGLDKYLSNGGQDVDPVALHQHDLTDAVAIPGLHPFSSPWGGASSSAMTLGADGGAQIHLKPQAIGLGAENPFDAVAMAQKVRDALQALIETFNGHTHHVDVTGTSTAQTGTTATPGSPATGAPNVGSATVKVVD